MNPERYIAFLIITLLFMMFVIWKGGNKARNTSPTCGTFYLWFNNFS